MKKMSILLIALGLIIGSSVQGQTVTLYTDKAAWSTDLVNLGLNEETLATTPTNMALAAEIFFPPETDEALGHTLHWGSYYTHLDLNFLLDVLNVCSRARVRGLAYDNALAGFPVGQRLISIGENSTIEGLCPEYTNDDFDIIMENVAPSPCGIQGVGVEIFGNGVTTGESLSIYGENDVLLKQFTSGWPADNNKDVGHFLGIISTSPVTKFRFDEDSGPDNIAIRDFSFGTTCGTVATETSSWGSMKSTYR